MSRRRTGHQRSRGHGVGGIVQSPEVVRTEIRKTKAYVDGLNKDVTSAYEQHGATMTPAQTKWFEDYAEWTNRFEAWAQSNLNDPWSPMQVLATGSISDQNDVWLKEAKEKQTELKGMGFASSGKSPTPLPGGPDGGGGGIGTWLSGLGTGGGLVLLGLGLWYLSERKGGR